MKKQFWLLIIVAMVAGGMLEARGGRGGGRGGRGGHRGGGRRGFHRGGGHRRGHRGGWGRRGWGGPWGGYGYGYGPGVSLAIPIGGSSGPRMPGSVKQFKRENGYYPNSVSQFCNWANGYFNPGKAQRACNRYKNYVSGASSSYSRPSGYLSFGVGGGYGGYGRRGWW